MRPGDAGSIYPILAALEADSLIAGRDEGDRRTYDITEKGKQHLDEHCAASVFHDCFDSADEEDEESEERERPGGGLRESASRLMQAVSQIGPSSKPETIERVRDLLDRARRESYTPLAQE